VSRFSGGCAHGETASHTTHHTSMSITPPPVIMAHVSATTLTTPCSCSLLLSLCRDVWRMMTIVAIVDVGLLTTLVHVLHHQHTDYMRVNIARLLHVC